MSGGLRLGLWRAMFEAIGNAPWLGWGWNQVSLGHLSVALEHDAGQRMFQNGHSIALDLALWMGIPLAAVVFAFAIHWVLQQVRRCHDGPRWALLLAIGAIGIHAMTEYPLDYAYFLLTLGLLVGTVQGLAPMGRVWSAAKATFVIPWAVSVGMLGWFAVEYVQVEESTRQVRMVLAGVGVDKVAFVPPPDVILLDAQREYHRFWITPARNALATGLNGRPEAAAAMLRAICNIHPPARCNEARESWRSAQAQHEVLRAVPGP
jgi:Virulence factor membrane-bound polymerase, C-terminal